MSGIGVVYNPHAKANRGPSGRRVQRLKEALGRDGAVRVTDSLAQIEEVARDFHDQGVEIMAICGGDGSYHCTLTAFHRVYADDPLPMLLPLRAGTINYISDAIGGRRGRPEQILSRVVRDYRRGHTYETTERDVLEVNGNELGFLLGFGTTVNYLRAYYAMEKQGSVSAGRLLARLIVSAIFGTHISRAVFQSTEADIECDGEPVPFRQYPFFFAATIERMALGFRPTYLGTRKRGFFHVIGGPIPPRRLIRRALRIYRGFPTNEPTLWDNLAQRMTIRFFRPTHWMLDGDILPPTERLDVRVARRVTLIRR